MDGTSMDTTPPEKSSSLPEQSREKTRSRGKRPRMRNSHKQSNSRFVSKQMAKHVVDGVESALSVLTVGVNSFDRMVDISLIQLVWIVADLYTMYIMRPTSTIRGLVLEPLEILQYTIAMVRLRMSHIHRVRRPSRGYMVGSIEQYAAMQAACSSLPPILATWLRNFGIFEYCGNTYIPIPDRSPLWYTDPSLVENWTKDVLFIKNEETSAFLALFFQKVVPKTFRPVGTHAGKHYIPRKRPRTSEPDVSYAPASPQGGGAGPSGPPDQGDEDPDVPPEPNPDYSTHYAFDENDQLDEPILDWRKFMYFCNNFPDRVEFDHNDVSGTAAQLVFAKTEGRPTEVLTYLSGYVVSDILFRTGMLCGYGVRHKEWNYPYQLAARFGDEDDSNRFMTATPSALISSVLNMRR